MRFVLTEVPPVLRHRDVAILYRRNRTGEEIKEALRAAGVPFQSRGQTLWNAGHIQNIMAVFRVLLDTSPKVRGCTLEQVNSDPHHTV